MSSNYIGEIRMFGGYFAPLNWAFCNGQTLAISQNDVLYSLIGTTYGGDGIQTFALPDLQGRVPVCEGQGTGLTNRNLAEKAGTETVGLTQAQMPAHSHSLNATTSNAGTPNVNGQVPADVTSSGSKFYTVPFSGDNPPVPQQLPATACTTSGGSQPHDNMMPYLCVTFIIALYGIYPTRN